MISIVLCSCLGLMQPGVGQTPKGPLDLSPVKAPLERVAGAVEKALSQIETVKLDALWALNWSVLAGSVLITILVMHTVHLHGLAASKTNLLGEGKPT